MTRQWTTCFAAVLLVAIAGVGTAQPESIEELRARAEQGDADAQSSLGLMYATGRGVPQDYVQAYMWLSLSASRSSGEARDRAVDNRDIAYEKLTFNQRAEAQRLAREWDEAHRRD